MLTLTTTLLSATIFAPQGEEIQKPEIHQGSLLVEAKRIYIDKDRVLENDSILIRNGKVLYVGSEIPEDAKKNATRISFPDGTVVPGFVNPHSSLGHGTNLAERIDTFTPELQASDAFDPFIPALLQSARAGVTTVGLVPSSTNAFAGQAAAVHTGRIGRILVESTFLKLSMIDAAFDQNRFPTSRMGAADLIRTTFGEARSALGPSDERLKILHDAVSGARQLAFHVKTEAEINAVLDLAVELSLKPLLIGCDEGHKRADRIAKICSGVVLAPLGFGSPKKRLGFPATMEKLGVPFSFMAERAEDLRISAALAVRHGASVKTVLAALTETAAKHAQASDLVGTLFEGKSADFCVFAGNPLDLTSRLSAVYIAGISASPSKRKGHN
jgi:imidazolonepropionase-like amidohydrolase